MKAAVDQNMKKKVISVTDPGLLNRTAWTNAAVALDHIKKVGALVQCLCVEQCQCTRRRGQQGGTGWPLIETSPPGWAGLGWAGLGWAGYWAAILVPAAPTRDPCPHHTATRDHRTGQSRHMCRVWQPRRMFPLASVARAVSCAAP